MASKSVTKKPKGATQSIQVTLNPKYGILPSRMYSNYLEVSQTPYDFNLKFCDATPVTIDSKAEDKITHDIPIVAEIAIPFLLMPRFIKALQAQYEKHKKLINGEDNAKKTSGN